MPITFAKRSFARERGKKSTSKGTGLMGCTSTCKSCPEGAYSLALALSLGKWVEPFGQDAVCPITWWRSHKGVAPPLAKALAPSVPHVAWAPPLTNVSQQVCQTKFGQQSEAL